MNRLGTDNATVERLRTLQVRLENGIGILVQKADEVKYTASRPLFFIESSLFNATFFDGVFVCCVPDVVEFLGLAFPEDLLWEQVRLYRVSRVSLCGSDVRTLHVLQFEIIFRV